MRHTRRSRPLRLLWAPAVALVMAMTSPEASANHAPEASAGSKDVLAEAGELFRAGQEHYEASRFGDAIASWTQAYDLLPDEPQYRANRSFLAASLAQAHVEAYRASGNIDHLRTADELYGEYLELLDPSDIQTRQTIETERTRIEEILAREDTPEPEPEEEPEADEGEPSETDPAEQPEPEEEPESTPPDERPESGGIPPFTRWERRMAIAGGVNLILAIGTFGAAGALFTLRNQAEREGAVLARDPRASVDELRVKGESVRLTDQLAWTNLIFAGVFGAVGIGLTAAAIDRRVRRLRGVARVSPSVGPTGLGATFTGRF